MSAEKHTPGIDWQRAGVDAASAARGFKAAMQPMRTCSSTPSLIETLDGLTVAQATERIDGTETEKVRLAEMWCRARLLAAAPELLAVAECEEALDLPLNEGTPILVRHGWNPDDRFDLPASVFVKNLRRAAIAKATGAAA